MAKLKNPLLSLGAVGNITKAITFTRRRKVNIAEKYPVPFDAKSLAQLSWRHMYQKAIALWHALSATEQQEWQSLASRHQMTGFAYFMSMALKPNPGLYLPLQGGTMSGNIDMAKNKLLKLPLPTDSQEPLTLAYFTANIAPFLYKEGARVYRDSTQSIPNATLTALSFNKQRYDTDLIHSTTINPSRLTAKTAGVYPITINLDWGASVVGRRIVYFRFNGAFFIGVQELNPAAGGGYLSSPTQYYFGVNDYVEAMVYQNSGGPLLIITTANSTPEFAMHRIGHA